MSHDEELEQRIRKSLDRSIAGLDGETRSRLTAIRHRALAQRPTAWWQRTGVWAPATAFAAAALFAATMLIDIPPPGDSPLAMEDTDIALELLLGEDNPSDPDFYVWLEEMLLEQEAQDHAT